MVFYLIMNVILLGAGASKSYSASPTGKRMPIAADFFPIYRDLEIYTHPWVLRGKLEYFLREERGLDPAAILNGDVNIEDLHSDIEERMYETLGDTSSPDRIIHVSAFTELSSVFACVINTIQSGPVSTAHKELAQRLSPQDRVITFNWDTLMEGRWKLKANGVAIMDMVSLHEEYTETDGCIQIDQQARMSAQSSTSYTAHQTG